MHTSGDTKAIFALKAQRIVRMYFCKQEIVWLSAKGAIKSSSMSHFGFGEYDNIHYWPNVSLSYVNQHGDVQTSAA